MNFAKYILIGCVGFLGWTVSADAAITSQGYVVENFIPVSGRINVYNAASVNKTTEVPTTSAVESIVAALRPIDSVLNATSENAVQNKVVNTALAAKYGTVSISGTGSQVSSVSGSGSEITVTKSNVSIPVGSANATDYATIWVE